MKTLADGGILISDRRLSAERIDKIRTIIAMEQIRTGVVV